MPRVTPIAAKSDVPAEHHPVVDGVMQTFGRIRGPFSMLLHTPALARHFLGVVNFFRDESVVPQKLRSLAALTAAREREGAYVWAAQVDGARKAGVPESTIDLIRAKGDPAGLPAEERDVVVYVRQLTRTHHVDQALFDALLKRHDVKWMVELTAAASYFGFLCGIVNAFEVAVPPGGDALPK
jgi:4-carboxymuconolactone decarboxylase